MRFYFFWYMPGEGADVIGPFATEKERNLAIGAREEKDEDDVICTFDLHEDGKVASADHITAKYLPEDDGTWFLNPRLQQWLAKWKKDEREKRKHKVIAMIEETKGADFIEAGIADGDLMQVGVNKAGELLYELTEIGRERLRVTKLNVVTDRPGKGGTTE
jgi:hypothetical protein